MEVTTGNPMTKRTFFFASFVVAAAAIYGSRNWPAPKAPSLPPLTYVSDVVADSSARLQPEANVLPYEIHNTATGEEYCQMCAYAERPGTVAAYGNLHDEQFWSDLEKLQALQDSHKNFGFFGQVLDSKDSAAIMAEAKKHRITFPVVYAVDPAWESVYKVGGVSRTVYYSTDFKVHWINVGLDAPALAKLTGEIKSNPRS